MARLPEPLTRQKQRQQARRCLRQARQLCASGKTALAVKRLQYASRLDRHQYQAYYEMARLAVKSLTPERAIRDYQRAVICNRRCADALLQLGLLHEQRHDYARACKAFLAYVSLRPNDPQGYHHLGHIFYHLEQYKPAITVFLKALEYDPVNPGNYIQLAEALNSRGYLDYALDVYMGLSKLYPEMLGLISMLMGFLLEKNGLFEAACTCYAQALQRPNALRVWKLKQQLSYPYLMDSAHQIEQTQQKMLVTLELFKASVQLKPLTPQNQLAHFFYMLQTNTVYLSYHHLNPLTIRKKFAELTPALLPPIVLPPLPARRPGPIRIGLVSKEKSLNMTFVYMGALLDQLDHSRFEFILFCPSAQVKRLFNSQNMFHFSHPQARYQVLSTTPPVAAAQIHHENLDLLILTEPAWDPLQWLLGGLRLARFQATSLMNPGSSGLPEMDFFFSSTLIERPEADQDYSEQLVRFSTFPYWIPAYPLPDEPVSRADYGLESLKRIYVCPHNLQKFHPDFDPLLEGILRSDPEGHLVIIAQTFQSGLCDRLMERFRQRMPELMPRIWVLPELSQREFTGLLCVSDVLLDSLYYGGGNVSYQALFYGVPIITLPTTHMTGRITSALYRKLNLFELVAVDAEDYIRKAVQWAMDPEFKQRHFDAERIRQSLREDPEIVAEFSAWLEGLFLPGT